MTDPPRTPELIAAHGITPDEYARAGNHRARAEPDRAWHFSAMWNEHCSYKSSKKWLRTLPSAGPQVICGPGENAGVVDIGDGQAVVFKMESHNHPSYIEPYQGAATGMGGILRDVFTMGARPGCGDERAQLRGARPPRKPRIWCRGWSRASAVTATRSACPPWAERCASPGL